MSRKVLTNKMKVFILNNYKKMKRHELAESLGVSRASVNRFMRDNNLKTGQHNTYPKDVVKKVWDYYVKHGKKATSKKFPDVKVRSIVERHGSGGIHNRMWSFEEVMVLLRYSEYVPLSVLNELLGRDVKKNPRKTFSTMLGISSPYAANLNGIPYRFAKSIVSKAIPYLDLDHGHSMNLCLWVDIEKELSTDNSNIVSMVRSMARFQKWLHGGNPIRDVNDIIDYEKGVCFER